MSEVLDIHIQRSSVSKKIPFDKVYLFTREDRDKIPLIFRYALVLPLTATFIETLRGLKVAEYSHKKFHRDDKEIKQIPIVDKQPATTTKELSRQWWAEFEERYDILNRVVVVPILVSTVRKVIRPRYLHAKRALTLHAKTALSSKSPQLPIISEMAYLATPHPAPDDKIRPICTICPRMLLHLQGECVPGQDICYKSLDFSDIKGSSENASVQSDDHQDY